MRDLDEICKVAAKEGAAALEPDELDAYIAERVRVAARDAAFEERMRKNDEAMQNIADTQAAIAEAARVQLEALIATPVELKEV